MDNLIIELRKRILFPENGASFVPACLEGQDRIRAACAEYPDRRAFFAGAAAEIAIDLRSFLISWRLLPFVKEGRLSREDIEAQSRAFLALADELGYEKIHEANAEIDVLSKSSIKKMSEMWLSGKLKTFWGHDYASGILHSLRRGACFSTNNPSKNVLFKKDYPDEYRRILDETAQNNALASLEDCVSIATVKIVSINARQLRPIFDSTDGLYGFCCIQTDPFNVSDAHKMIQQVEFYDAAFKRELNTDTPNIVYKIPATEKGLEAAKYLAERGYRLCITLDFTVVQHDAFAKIISDAGAAGFVVLMGGLLDDKVTEELNALGVENAVAIGRHAAQAVIRKSYANLHAKGYDKSVSIMTAAVRGPWAIANTLASKGHGAQTAFTTLTAKIEEFDNAPAELISSLDTPLENSIMEALQKSKVFCKAFATEYEQPWAWDDLFTFPPFVAFYDQFRADYATLTEDMREIRIQKGTNQK